MDLLAHIDILDLFVNLKHFLIQLIEALGPWAYAVLFAFVFMETGLVIFPFLPGDTLLFTAGALAAGSASKSGAFDLQTLMTVLIFAPILGDSCNYWIGRAVGPKIFHKTDVRFLNREYLDRAHQFYEKHGGKAVAFGRFLPIIRTFVPFVAGIGKMAYLRFLAFSVIGTLAWISLCVLAGYYFGNLKFIGEHFELVIVAIAVISLIPAVVAAIRNRRAIAAKAKEKHE